MITDLSSRKHEEHRKWLVEEQWWKHKRLFMPRALLAYGSPNHDQTKPL